MENFMLDTTVSSVSSNSAARPLLSPSHSETAKNGSNMVSDTVNGFLKKKFKIIPKDFM
jgi:serine carboxypeptidase 1